MGELRGGVAPLFRGSFALILSFIAFCIIACLFAVIYKVLPDAPLCWRDAWIGADFTRHYAIGFGSLRKQTPDAA